MQPHQLKKKKKKIVKVVKVYLALSLVLWVVWSHFQGSSLCLTSSVCWSLQCLISILTQGGRWWTLFFKAHLFSHAVGREGRCKQITLACARSVSATLGMPLHTAHTAQALRCSAGNRVCWKLLPSVGRRISPWRIRTAK